MGSDDDDELAELRAARAARTGQTTLVGQQLCRSATSALRPQQLCMTRSVSARVASTLQSDLKRRAGAAEGAGVFERCVQKSDSSRLVLAVPQ
jgi:hypothetical protein